MAERPGESKTMRATRTARYATPAGRPLRRNAKRLGAASRQETFDPGSQAHVPQALGGKASAKPVRPVKAVAVPPEPVLYKLCKPGWGWSWSAFRTRKARALYARFARKSHRVPGPVRGFKKMRRAQWSRLRRVEE